MTAPSFLDESGASSLSPTQRCQGDSLPPVTPPLPGLAGRIAFDPLAPFAAVLPLMLAAASLNTALAALWVCAFSLPVLAVVNTRRGLFSAVAIVAFCGTLTLSMAHAVPLYKVGESAEVLHLWGASLTANQLYYGGKLGAKVAAVLSLAILSGLLASPQSLMRALVQHLHLPYRIPYAGVAALSFLDHFREQHRIIQEAHSLRGTRWRLPLVALPLRWVTSLPALTASAVRHAERVSISMDSRAFAAFPTRTEPEILRWRKRDTAAVIVCWAAAAFILYVYSSAGFILHDV